MKNVQSKDNKRSDEAKKCFNRSTTRHHDKGFSMEVREKKCQAFNANCKKYKKKGNFANCCRSKENHEGATITKMDHCSTFTVVARHACIICVRRL